MHRSVWLAAAVCLAACGGSSSKSAAEPEPPVNRAAPSASVDPHAPTSLAREQGMLVGVEVDATHVYWLDFTSGAIRRTALGGGDIETVVSGRADALTEEMVLVGSHVYWTTRSQNAILRVPKVGGSIEIAAPNQPFATAITADSSHLYWTADGVLRRMPIAGGTIDDIDVGDTVGEQLAVDREYLYVSGVGGARIVRVDKRTLAFEVLAYDGTPLGSSLAVFGEHLYYTGNDDAIRRVSRHGGATQLIAPPRGGTYALTAGIEGVYWGADSDNGMGAALYRMPRDSAPVVIAAGYRSIGDIVLSPDMVYFVDQDGGSVNMIPRSAR